MARNILVINENDDLRRVIKLYFSKVPDCHLFEAKNLSGARQLIEEQALELVIADSKPDCTEEITELLKTSQPRARVVFFGGFDDSGLSSNDAKASATFNGFSLNDLMNAALGFLSNLPSSRDRSNAQK